MTNKRTCGRGVLQFESFKPCRRPGQPPNPKSVAKKIVTALKPAPEAPCGNEADEGIQSPTAPQTPIAPTPPVQHGTSPVQLLAKHSFQANPDRPGEFDEMSLKQGEKVEFIKVHPNNPFWWEARNAMNQVAFVPASYMMVIEKKVSALPWLENKAIEERKEREEQERRHAGNGGPFSNTPSAIFKPYSSAYSGDTSASPSQSAKQFYCEVCNKQLNGIKPYQAHMLSKGHKEEMALC